MMKQLLKDIERAEQDLQTMSNMIGRSEMFPDMQLAAGDGAWRVLIQKDVFDEIVLNELDKRQKHLAKLKAALEAAEKTAKGWLADES